MRKITLTIIIIATFIAGTVVAASIFTVYVLPEAKHYMLADPQYIQLSEDAPPADYNEILNKKYLGDLFLNHPLYFYKREHGIEILSDLAHKGYTPAAGILFGYALRQGNKPTDKKQMNEARKWAHLAAMHGDYSALHSLFHVLKLYEIKDATQELALLEAWAPQSKMPVYAKRLSEYYNEQDRPQKSAYWADVAKSIRESPEAYERLECQIISPWKSY